MTDVLVNDSFSADTEVDCLIIGGGAAGLTAALAASQKRTNEQLQAKAVSKVSSAPPIQTNKPANKS